MLPKEWSINAYDTGHIRMDVHPQGYTKGTACEYLYQKLNIPKENTYAFGDGENDIEMLHLVGLLLRWVMRMMKLKNMHLL